MGGSVISTGCTCCASKDWVILSKVCKNCGSGVRGRCVSSGFAAMAVQSKSLSLPP